MAHSDVYAIAKTDRTSQEKRSTRKRKRWQLQESGRTDASVDPKTVNYDWKGTDGRMQSPVRPNRRTSLIVDPENGAFSLRAKHSRDKLPHGQPSRQESAGRRADSNSLYTRWHHRKQRGPCCVRYRDRFRAAGARVNLRTVADREGRCGRRPGELIANIAVRCFIINGVTRVAGVGLSVTPQRRNGIRVPPRSSGPVVSCDASAYRGCFRVCTATCGFLLDRCPCGACLAVLPRQWGCVVSGSQSRRYARFADRTLHPSIGTLSNHSGRFWDRPLASVSTAFLKAASASSSV